MIWDMHTDPSLIRDATLGPVEDQRTWRSPIQSNMPDSEGGWMARRGPTLGDMKLKEIEQSG